ncbi:MAG: cation-transporting P-type ATPase, partial [Bacilli bacterium]|nr:cation-transporting P-type ATPase [Bacilli bacterium]
MEFNGLTDAEVIEAREKYGGNNIEAKNENHFFKLLIESFGDPIIKILLIALAVKVVFLFRE